MSSHLSTVEVGVLGGVAEINDITKNLLIAKAAH